VSHNECVHFLDGDRVFAFDLGKLHRTSARYSGMWIRRRTLPSSASTCTG